jgi:hypothetical protein
LAVAEFGPWKGSLEPRPMGDPVLKLLLICGYRFVDQQIAACVSTKVGSRERSRNNGRPSSDTATTPYP